MARKKKESIIVFCAHSDDQILGPGGTIAKYAKQGKDVYTIIYSYGEAGLPWLKIEVAIQTRVKEANDADKVIGGKGVSFFGLKEGHFLGSAKELRRRIQQMVLSKRPTKIFTHSIDDPHPDHKDVYNSVIDALEEMHYRCDVYSFDIWNPFNYRKTDLPKLYEDITKTFPKKVEAIKVFKSQKIALFTLFWTVYARAIVHGFKIHTRYAERFFKVR